MIIFFKLIYFLFIITIDGSPTSMNNQVKITMNISD
jgi:hypothetical protein